MPGLREIQQQFADGVLDPDRQNVCDLIRARGLTRPQRLQIYRNNIFSSLTEALRATHPVVEKLVGEGFFRYAAHEFILGHPSTSGDLEDFGAGFAPFLGAFPGARDLPYLADVARLEWLYHEVYHAAEQSPLDLDRLATVAPADHETLHFTLHPAARLMRSPFPVLRIWQANQEGTIGDDTISLDIGGVQLLIRRREDVEFLCLEAGEFEFLQRLDGGACLGEAAQAAASSQADFDLAAVLARMVGNGTLTDFRVGTSHQTDQTTGR